MTLLLGFKRVFNIITLIQTDMTLEEYTQKALDILHEAIKDKEHIGPLEQALIEDAGWAYFEGWDPDTLVASITTGL